MKRLILAIAVCVLTLSGCATTGPAQTPAEVAARVCPSVQIALTSLQGLVGLNETLVADMKTAQPIVAAACTGATVSAVDLKSLSASAIPTVITIVKASPLSADEQNQILLGLAAAQIIIASLP